MLDNSLRAYYTLYKNSAKLQQEFNGSILFGYDYSKTEDDNLETKVNNLDYGIEFENETRLYFKPKMFFGVGM